MNRNKPMMDHINVDSIEKRFSSIETVFTTIRPTKAKDHDSVLPSRRNLEAEITTLRKRPVSMKGNSVNRRSMAVILSILRSRRFPGPEH